MRIACDFDGTLVSQARPYSDIMTPLEWIDGAKEAIVTLKAAGHMLVLWSSRASRALLYDPTLDPLVRAGVVQVHRQQWLESRALNLARYHEMLAFVNREIPGVFDAIDDGSAGKFSFDLVIDNKAICLRGPATWARIARVYGEHDPPPFGLDLPPALLDTPVARLNLVPTGELKQILDQVRGELRGRGIAHYQPLFALGDAGFWCADRAITINLPWFLATEELFQAAQPRYPLTWFDVVRGVRHEVGHAIGYAFELWKRRDWTEVFGNFRAPYPERPWPYMEHSPNHIEYVLDSGAGYGQRHPDEDWAESFAAWLDSSYPKGSLQDGARRKIEYVDRIARQVLTGRPVNDDLGVPKEWRSAYPGQTVGQALGFAPPWK